MIKAIFFDIDGTLVSFKTHAIPPSSLKALKILREKGIKLFIATGRGKDGLEVVKDIEFDGYITLNGQYCFTGDQVIYENTIQKEDLEILIKELEEHPVPCGFTLENDKIFNFRDERVDEVHAITHNDDHPAGDISNIMNEKVYQCMCFLSEEEEKELLLKLPHCTSARWYYSFCDISPIGGTKQLGIDKFLEYYNIPLSQTLSIGDGGNDLQMLEHTQYSIAMGNAKEELKRIADYVTDDIDHDGLSKGLKHFDLI